MRAVLIVITGLAATAVLWVSVVAWRWSNADFAAIFRNHVRAEAPQGASIAFPAGAAAIAVGRPSAGARFVCGQATLTQSGQAPQPRTYSLFIFRGLFGTFINDGFTPATPPESQALSDEQCTRLRAYIARIKKEG